MAKAHVQFKLAHVLQTRFMMLWPKEESVLGLPEAMSPWSPTVPNQQFQIYVD